MSTCRFDREASDYLTPEGEPCRRDEHGDKTYHCQARRTCSQHVARGELTCARCISRVRQDIRAVVQLAALMPVEALTGGVDSEALMMGGPSADPQVFEARRAIGRAWIYANIHQEARDWCDDQDCTRRHFKTGPGLDRWHKRGIENALADLLEEDDDRHPSVLIRWAWMIAEDYGDQRVGTISEAAAYLDRKLHTIAQDEGQDFPLLRREMRACRQHLEAVLHNSSRPERGAPCPICAEDQAFVRLTHEYGHFCLDPDCTQQHHYLDDTGDRWVCPRKREHAWTEAAYRAYVEERSA